MMRSLWTAASGMIAQQNNVDTISNNLANVNTTGYKNETAEFKTLLYQSIQSRTTSANGDTKPIAAQVGLGTRNSSITSHYQQGALQPTDEQFDLAIQGNGFFKVRTLNGDYSYTRAGHFTMAVSGTEGMFKLCTSEGLPVMAEGDREIILESSVDLTDVGIDGDGRVTLLDEMNNPVDTGYQISLYQFANPSGLEKTGDTLLRETEASGVAMNENEYSSLEKSVVKQKYLERSNVQVADEMVNLIVAQRAYELNSKAITTSDEMMQTANNLKR